MMTCFAFPACFRSSFAGFYAEGQQLALSQTASRPSECSMAQFDVGSVRKKMLNQEPSTSTSFLSPVLEQDWPYEEKLSAVVR